MRAQMVVISRILAMAILAAPLLRGAEGPNVLVILSGDQGYGELSSSGHPLLKTPRLDRLRGEGMDFRRMIGSPYGTGSRAQLLSGLHEFRCGVSHTLGGRNLIRPGVVLLPEIFGKAGYRTALIGRWGLGEAYPCRPEDRGFEDIWICGGSALGHLADCWGNSARKFRVRTRDGWKERDGYANAVWADEAKRYLALRAGDGKPFFLHLGFTAPQAPYEAPPGTADRFRAAGVKEPLASYLALLEDLDAKVGSVLDELDRLGLAEKTLVVFAGENGPPFPTGSANLKGVAGSADEGGVRVPAFVRWTGKIPANQKTEDLSGLDDLFESIVGLTGLKPVARDGAEGRDLSGYLLGSAKDFRKRTIYTHVGCWGGDDRPEGQRTIGFAVREGSWVLSGLDLCDVGSDPGQKTSLFDQHQDVGTRLLGAYGVWWGGIVASVREPVRYVIGDPHQQVVKLTATDWWPSREVGGALGADSVVTLSSVRRKLGSFAESGDIPETAGVWKVRVAREGHYRVRAAMIPGDAPQEEINRLGQLKAGMLHLRTGKKEVQMQIVKGATSATLNMDLPGGDLDLEVWFSGQLEGGRILGALFLELERTGDRKRPDLDIDFHTVPKK